MAAVIPKSSATVAGPAPGSRVWWQRELRRWHGWIGLWGAVIGLLFGVSGVLLNHRALLKLPLPPPQESSAQLTLPDTPPDNARALVAWVRTQLAIEAEPGRIREEPAHPVSWGEQSLMQPAHWMFGFATPRSNVQVDYWVGSRTVTVKRSEGTVYTLLGNLHKGVGLGIGWVLLIDTFAGSIVLLSLSGLALWTLQHRGRLRGLLVAAAALAAMLGLALSGA